MRSMFNDIERQALLTRLRRLEVGTRARWGRLSAPGMVVHLIDQMRITLGELPCDPMPGILRYSPIRELILYWAPWPRGVSGPPEAFTTTSTSWTGDLTRLESLVEQFVRRGPEGTWPDHPRFGRMTGTAWGIFCYRHFDHHIHQFGG